MSEILQPYWAIMIALYRDAALLGPALVGGGGTVLENISVGCVAGPLFTAPESRFGLPSIQGAWWALISPATYVPGFNLDGSGPGGIRVPSEKLACVLVLTNEASRYISSWPMKGFLR